MRELVVLGTAGQVPTRERNVNGYLLRWDDEGLLFDPGEGTQRQMLFAGVKSSMVTRILLTHFHDDHCLGLPGVIHRLALDGVADRVRIYYAAGGQHYLDRLLRSSASHGGAGSVELRPVIRSGLVESGPPFTITALPLRHGVEVLGWRLEEPDGRRMLPERLSEAGVEGPRVGRLLREGVLDDGGRRVTLDEVSEARLGQRFAFIMDTGFCDAAIELAADADMVVCESTYHSSEAELADRYGHLTAAQAATIARRAGARLLVLTHFSQRYSDVGPLVAEAQAIFPETVAAEDLATIPVPARR